MDLSRFESLLQSHSPAVRGLLAVGELFYRCGQHFVAQRTRTRFQRGTWPVRLDVPVVSVGNVVAGGVGKTPLVEALARAHRDRGGRPGLLSRGYKSRGGSNDEAELLARRLPDVPHVQNPDRIAGGRELLAAHPEVDLIILDDGFQHRRVHRDVDIVVMDATRPLGFGHLLPRGYLREPWRGIDRADAIVVTRSADASRQKLAILRSFLIERKRARPVVTADTVVEAVEPLGSSPAIRAGARVLAFAGIGNPRAFYRTVERTGFEVVATRSFPDHHHFRDEDLRSLLTEAERSNATGLVCTEKDGVKVAKLSALGTASLPVAELRMRFDVDVATLLDLASSASDELHPTT